MKRIDRELVKRIVAQAQGICEYCGIRGGDPLHGHHIFSRGAGQVDIPGNIIALCGGYDGNCHGQAHAGQIAKDSLLAIAAAREGTTPEATTQEVWRIRRADKYAEVQ